MGIATHIDFNGFELVTRLTKSIVAADLNNITEVFGDYMEGRTVGTSINSHFFIYQASGMVRAGNNFTTTYFFTNEDFNVIALTKYTTTATFDDLPIRSTATFEASTEYDSISTTWEDISIEIQTRNRAYTELSSSNFSYYGLTVGGALEPRAECNRTNGLKAIIEKRIGPDWTVDGSYLLYYQLFTATGTYDATYGSNFFDSNLQKTISATSAQLFASEGTREGSTVSLTYTSTFGGTTTISLTESLVETQVNGQLYLTSRASSTTPVGMVSTASSSLSYVLREGFSETRSTGSVRALYGERITSVKTTAVHYVVDNFYTFNSSFTYGGLVDTTASYSYYIASAEFGTASQTGEYTDQEGTSTVTKTGTTSTFKPLLGSVFFVSYYSFLLGTSNTDWGKSYAQKYPFNQFALAFTEGNISKYAGSINSPYDVALTSYKFDILSDSSLNPKIYIPINATQYSYDEEDPLFLTKTVQSVSIPSAFYYGSGSATISRTTFTETPTGASNSFESKLFGYGGAQSTGLGRNVSKHDFQNSYWNPPFSSTKIMHTIGVLGKGSASYNMNGYYVYKSNLNRTTAGDSINPISVIGNGQVSTVIASRYVASVAFPYVLIAKTYVNSYQ